MNATAQVIPFQFEALQIRTLRIDDQPWFVAADLCKALGIANTTQALQALDDDERSMFNIGRQGNANVVNESGLFTLILRSREATTPGTPQHRFRKWVTAEVLPAIRKHGSYTDTNNKMGTLIGETIGTNGFNMLGALIKGKVTSLPANVQRKATAKIWSQTHAAFGVRSAADIPASQLDAARNFIAAYALEGEWLPKQAEAAAVELDAYAAQYVYLLLSAISGMQQDRERLGDAARQLESRPLMRVYNQLRESRSAFGYLDQHVARKCYQAWRGLGAQDGGYLMGIPG